MDKLYSEVALNPETRCAVSVVKKMYLSAALVLVHVSLGAAVLVLSSTPGIKKCEPRIRLCGAFRIVPLPSEEGNYSEILHKNGLKSRPESGLDWLICSKFAR